jgi:hypothetical protein
MSNYATALIDEPTQNPPTMKAASSSTENLLGSLDGQSESAQQMHRLAARMNASAVSEEETKSLLDERKSLLDKKFAGTMTKKEANRLAYVRWSLDRIEDAKSGAWIDKLEQRVAELHKLAEHLQNLEEKLERASGNKYQGRRSSPR